VHPGVYDPPGDGIDQDCDGVDPTLPGETGGTGAIGTTPTGPGTTPTTPPTSDTGAPSAGTRPATGEDLKAVGCSCDSTTPVPEGTTPVPGSWLALGAFALRRRVRGAGGRSAAR
jgi:hypothetical protein